MRLLSISRVRPMDLAVLLAALYFLTVALVPFEAMDRSFARLFCQSGSDAWFWAGLLYSAAQWGAGCIVAGVVVCAVRAYKANNQPLTDVLIRTVASVLISLLFMFLLKQWGYASTGCCLLGLFFAARRLKKAWAGWVFVAVFVFGSFCAFGGMLQDGNLLSHAVVSLLLEFTVTGLIFWPDAKDKKVMSITQAAIFAALPLTLLALPFFSELASLATLKSFSALAASFLFFVLIWTGVFLLIIRLAPRCGWRWILALLALIGAGADAFTTLYGTVMTPDMVRNAVSTLCLRRHF